MQALGVDYSITLHPVATSDIYYWAFRDKTPPPRIFGVEEGGPMAERMPGPLGFASTYKMSCCRLYCAELGLSPSSACYATWIVCSPTMATATGDGCSINTEKCIHKYWYPYIYTCMCVYMYVRVRICWNGEEGEDNSLLGRLLGFLCLCALLAMLHRS